MVYSTGDNKNMSVKKSTFSSDMGINVGIIASVVLIVLLIFLEVSQPMFGGRTMATLGRLRVRFSTVTWILFIIFLGIVYTKIVMIVSS